MKPIRPSRRLFEKSGLISKKENATRARHPRPRATDFRPPHVSDHPRHENGRSVSSHPSSPGNRHSSTALPYLLQLCYRH